MIDHLKTLDLAPLVPDAYARYRPLIQEAMGFFLSRLPPDRRRELAEVQLRLPGTAGLIDRLIALLQACPSLHKLGQVLAHEQALLPELRSRLQALESMPPLIPMSELLSIIQTEVGHRTDIHLEAAPLAEASVAVVIPFSWRPADDRPARSGIFKVLKPGVEKKLEEELAVWSALGDFLEEGCLSRNLPELQYKDTLDRMRQLLSREVRLDLEQAHLARAAADYAGIPEVIIPDLLPLCTSRITAMQRIHGSPATRITDLSRESRGRLALILADNLIAKPLWNPAERALFHADPHAGNLLITPELNLGVLDWSLMTELSLQQRRSLIRIPLSALTLDEAGMGRALEELSVSTVPGEPFRNIIARSLQDVRQGRFPGFSWLIALLDRAAIEAALPFPEEMILFRKALYSLSGVINDLLPGFPLDQALLRASGRHVLESWTQPAFCPGPSASLGGPLLGTDLLQLWLEAPLTAMRYWNGLWQDSR
jgi:ubiquinone biosynthesis protein